VLPKALRAASEALTSITRVDAYLQMNVQEKASRSGAPGVTMVSHCPTATCSAVNIALSP